MKVKLLCSSALSDLNGKINAFIEENNYELADIKLVYELDHAQVLVIYKESKVA